MPEPGLRQPDDTTDDAVLAFDIGGANLKAADGLGWCHAEPFAMWQEHSRLAEALKQILSQGPACRRVVATMTGEIADCFVSRTQGVRAILAALTEACRDRQLQIYLVDGSLVSSAVAGERCIEAAASNWHAVATLAAGLAKPEHGLLIDAGSTTIDIVPFREGRPCPLGRDDVSRLATGELVYTGIERTPVASLVQALPWRGRLHPIARERFADVQDAWLLQGMPLPSTRDTADGRPLDIPFAAARLARMLLLDASDWTLDEARQAAEFIVMAQVRLVVRCLQQVAATAAFPPAALVLSGHGDMLTRRCLQQLNWPNCRIISLAEQIGFEASRVGPAYALALIARGRSR